MANYAGTTRGVFGERAAAVLRASARGVRDFKLNPITQGGKAAEGGQLRMEKQSSSVLDLGDNSLRGRSDRAVDILVCGVQAAPKVVFRGTLWLGCGIIWSVVVTVFYWGVLDRQQPVDYISDKAAYHSLTHKLELSREVKRNRFCKGTKSWYIQDGFKQPLADEEVPSDKVYVVGHDRPGEQFTAVLPLVNVDPRILDTFDVVITTEYRCNVWQRWFPLVVHSPNIHVPQEAWLTN